jgi:4-oxalocrotonate tautomerase family enzyme
MVKAKLAQREKVMPIIRVDILEGRPETMKTELAERLTQTLSDVMGVPPEATHVIIEEHDKRHWSVGGVRYIDK